MFNGFFQQTHKKISFEDMQLIISTPKEYVIINTLISNEQHCLIKNTISYQTEEKVINEYINQYDFNPKFVIYGKNTNDKKIETDETLKDVLKYAFNSRSFMLLVTGFFICGFHVNFIVAHLPAYISDMSLPSNVSTTSLALIGFANIFGVAIAGRLGDKFNKSDVLVVLYSLRAIVFIIYIINTISIMSTLYLRLLLVFSG